jgi:hypothetical protein
MAQSAEPLTGTSEAFIRKFKLRFPIANQILLGGIFFAGPF